MGKGGGKSLQNTFKVAAEWVSNVYTMGLAGYDSDTGKLKKGIITHAADESYGEVSGRNLARQEANKAEVRLNEEKLQMDKDLKAKQLQDYRSDLMASRGAQGIRDSATSRAQGGIASAAANKDVLGDEKDVLGL